MVHLTSPQLLSKRYLPWRLLRAPGRWAKFYASRARKVAGHKSALVFPEQLIAINGATIYAVENNQPTTHTPQDYTGLSIQRLHNVRLVIDGVKDTPTVQDVYEFEDDNSSGQITNWSGIQMLLGNSNRRSDGRAFFNSVLFSDRADAVKFAKKIITQIG